MSGWEWIRSVMYLVGFPNLLVRLHPDYVLTHLLTPLASTAPTSGACGPSRKRLRRNPKPDFDPSYALEFWDLTNRQDWAACESVQRPALTARAAGATRAGRGRRVPVRHPCGSGLRRGSLSLHRRRSPRTVGDRHLCPVQYARRNSEKSLPAGAGSQFGR
jgi:hypothetical protein